MSKTYNEYLYYDSYIYRNNVLIAVMPKRELYFLRPEYVKYRKKIIKYLYTLGISYVS